MQDLASRIELLAAGKAVSVFSSTGPRSVQGAQVVAQALGLRPLEREFLGSRLRGKEAENYPEAADFLEAAGVGSECVVVVTKGEFANRFLAFYGNRKLGAEFGEVALGRGEAYAIDCEGRTCRPF